MKWTTEKPKEPGYYFFRWWAYNSDEPREIVIKIYRDEGGLWVNDARDIETPWRLFGELHPIARVRCEYAGPILEPTE